MLAVPKYKQINTDVNLRTRSELPTRTVSGLAKNRREGCAARDGVQNNNFSKGCLWDNPAVRIAIDCSRMAAVDSES